ncbi:DNA-binding GntR family transcriptional regulator [Rhodoligotrophos appendicifer]|uniref:GntR family transcriptional regulator n=1 Tax=Rhodoligotrophos appendicifer TaxID=987056 RepID=UPI001186DEE4|nr:GntR family transcriptional regulator [Rhodoligotrophos appendicifer]
MNVTGTARKQTHERVYESLKRDLMRGDLMPGERLVVARLAKRFGTSAMPIRQALQRLVADKALNERPHRGVEVAMLSAEEMMDLRRIRCAIEGQAAEWACQTISDTELEKLHSIQQQLLAIANGTGSGNYLELNLTFHFTVYHAARSPLLIPIIETLWLQAGPCLNIMRTKTTLGLGLEDHNRVLRALERGDGPSARAAVEHELTEAAEIMGRALSHQGSVQKGTQRSRSDRRPVIA